MSAPTLGQMIAAMGSPSEWSAIDPIYLRWNSSLNRLEGSGVPPWNEGAGYFLSGIKEGCFYHDNSQVGVMLDGYGNAGLGENALIRSNPINSSHWRSGSWNIAVGENALVYNDSGWDNVAIGWESMFYGVGSGGSVALGAWTLSNQQGSYNSQVAIGSVSMCSLYLSDSWENVAIGIESLEYLFYGDWNTAIGPYAEFWGGQPDFLGIWGSAANDIFLVGHDGIIFHYNGSSWSEMDSGQYMGLTAIWGSASDDVFVVGYSGIILHYDGANWSKMYLDPEYWNGYFDVIWGSASNDVFVTGSNSGIFHYDGVSWSQMSHSLGDFYVYGLWGTSSSNVYAVGFKPIGIGVIFHYDGAAWSEVTPEGSYRGFSDIWGSAADDIFVVGDRGVILHYDGANWTETIIDDNITFNSIWGSSSTNVIVGGAYPYNIIYRYDGSIWTPESICAENISPSVNSIWGTSASNIYLAGWNYTFFHYNGTAWSDATDPLPFPYYQGENVAVGNNSLEGCYKDSYGNVAVGSGAMSGWRPGSLQYSEDRNTVFDENTAVGLLCMENSSAAGFNTCFGAYAGEEMDLGSFNIAIGYNAMNDSVGPINNIAIGAYAGNSDEFGENDIYIGYESDIHVYKGSYQFNYTLTTGMAGINYGGREYAISFMFGVVESPLMPIGSFYWNPNPNTWPYYRILHIQDVPTYPPQAGMAPLTCTARKIYRSCYYLSCKESIPTDITNKYYYYLDTIPDNTTITFDDDTPDADLGEIYVGLSNMITIGANTLAEFSNTLVIGDGIIEGFFGGMYSAVPKDFTFNPTGGEGSNKAGADIIWAGGRSTGNVGGGKVKFQVAAAGSSGSFWNPLADALVIDDAKVIQEFSEVTGAGTPQLGTNCPAVTVTAPYTWWKIKTTDGSIGYTPVWK